FLDISLRSRTLVDLIRAVKRQLAKVLTEIDELQRFWQSSEFSQDLGTNPGRAESVKKMMATGRIRDIMDEYDDKIDECKKMAQNLSLAMQTGWNQIARQDSQVNTMIAIETKRESSQMRSIALLTMIFLPLSCLASVFSTTLFNWNPDSDEPIVSKYIWILIVLAILLTAVTVGAWHISTNMEKKREAAELELPPGSV
ncbi:hypothetical protein QBC44DRAFT_246098, partial [Cladorrhinum sp. PSN332]